MDEVAVAAALGAKNTLTTLPLTATLDLLIDRRENSVEVALVNNEDRKFLQLREYFRIGCALNFIRRIAEELELAVEADAAVAEVPLVNPMAATEAVDMVSAEPKMGGAPKQEGPLSIWKEVTKIVKHQTVFANDNTAVQVAVYPSEGGWHVVEITWKGHELNYDVEGEHNAKVRGRQVAELILEGCAA